MLCNSRCGVRINVAAVVEDRCSTLVSVYKSSLLLVMIRDSYQDCSLHPISETKI